MGPEEYENYIFTSMRYYSAVEPEEVFRAFEYCLSKLDGMPPSQQKSKVKTSKEGDDLSNLILTQVTIFLLNKHYPEGNPQFNGLMAKYASRLLLKLFKVLSQTDKKIIEKNFVEQYMSALLKVVTSAFLNKYEITVEERLDIGYRLNPYLVRTLPIALSLDDEKIFTLDVNGLIEQRIHLLLSMLPIISVLPWNMSEKVFRATLGQILSASQEGPASNRQEGSLSDKQDGAVERSEQMAVFLGILVLIRQKLICYPDPANDTATKRYQTQLVSRFWNLWLGLNLGEKIQTQKYYFEQTGRCSDPARELYLMATACISGDIPLDLGKTPAARSAADTVSEEVTNEIIRCSKNYPNEQTSRSVFLPVLMPETGIELDLKLLEERWVKATFYIPWTVLDILVNDLINYVDTAEIEPVADAKFNKQKIYRQILLIIIKLCQLNENYQIRGKVLAQILFNSALEMTERGDVKWLLLQVFKYYARLSRKQCDEFIKEVRQQAESCELSFQVYAGWIDVLGNENEKNYSLYIVLRAVRDLTQKGMIPLSKDEDDDEKKHTVLMKQFNLLCANRLARDSALDETAASELLIAFIQRPASLVFFNACLYKIIPLLQKVLLTDSPTSQHTSAQILIAILIRFGMHVPSKLLHGELSAHDLNILYSVTILLFQTYFSSLDVKNGEKSDTTTMLDPATGYLRISLAEFFHNSEYHVLSLYARLLSLQPSRLSQRNILREALEVIPLIASTDQASGADKKMLSGKGQKKTLWDILIKAIKSHVEAAPPQDANNLINMVRVLLVMLSSGDLSAGKEDELARSRSISESYFAELESKLVLLAQGREAALEIQLDQQLTYFYSAQIMLTVNLPRMQLEKAVIAILMRLQQRIEQLQTEPIQDVFSAHELKRMALTLVLTVALNDNLAFNERIRTLCQELLKTQLLQAGYLAIPAEQRSFLAYSPRNASLAAQRFLEIGLVAESALVFPDEATSLAYVMANRDNLEAQRLVLEKLAKTCVFAIEMFRYQPAEKSSSSLMSIEFRRDLNASVEHIIRSFIIYVTKTEWEKLSLAIEPSKQKRAISSIKPSTELVALYRSILLLTNVSLIFSKDIFNEEFFDKIRFILSQLRKHATLDLRSHYPDLFKKLEEIDNKIAAENARQERCDLAKSAANSGSATGVNAESKTKSKSKKTKKTQKITASTGGDAVTSAVPSASVDSYQTVQQRLVGSIRTLSIHDDIQPYTKMSQLQLLLQEMTVITQQAEIEAKRAEDIYASNNSQNIPIRVLKATLVAVKAIHDKVQESDRLLASLTQKFITVAGDISEDDQYNSVKKEIELCSKRFHEAFDRIYYVQYCINLLLQRALYAPLKNLPFLFSRKLSSTQHHEACTEIANVRITDNIKLVHDYFSIKADWLPKIFAIIHAVANIVLVPIEDTKPIEKPRKDIEFALFGSIVTELRITGFFPETMAKLLSNSNIADLDFMCRYDTKQYKPYFACNPAEGRFRDDKQIEDMLSSAVSEYYQVKVINQGSRVIIKLTSKFPDKYKNLDITFNHPNKHVNNLAIYRETISTFALLFLRLPEQGNASCDIPAKLETTNLHDRLFSMGWLTFVDQDMEPGPKARCSEVIPTLLLKQSQKFGNFFERCDEQLGNYSAPLHRTR